MPRDPAEYRALHVEADRFEPRVARAYRKSVARMEAQVDVDALERAFRAGNRKRVLAILDQIDIDDALSPLLAIFRDAVLRGGRLGADLLEEAFK